MNSKKIKKAICLFVAMALVCVASVAGTLAVLKAQTTGLTNTFTATKTLMDDNSKFTVTESVGKDFTIIPLASYTKDPVVDTGIFQTDAVVYLEVVVANNEASLNGVPDTTVVNFDINNTNWEILTGKTGANGGQLYVYKPTAEEKVTDNNYAIKSGKALASVEILAGNKVTISDFTDSDNVTVQPTISFYGYAVQSLYSTGVGTTGTVNSAETAYAAWDATWDPAP